MSSPLASSRQVLDRVQELARHRVAVEGRTDDHAKRADAKKDSEDARGGRVLGRIGLRSGGGVVSPEETPGVIAAARPQGSRRRSPRVRSASCARDGRTNLSILPKLVRSYILPKRAGHSPRATPELPGRLDNVLHARSPRA